MKGRNVMVITMWSYKDALIQTYSLPYIKMISKYISQESSILLVTFEQKGLEISGKEQKEINDYLSSFKIEHISIAFQKNWFLKLLFSPFQLLYLFCLLGLKKVDTIHCFCTPAGVLGYILSILSRKRLIIDSFEPHAEPMIETGTWSKNGLPFKILFFFEGKMAKKADDLILCVSSMKSYVKEKFNVNIKAKYVKPACVDFSLFDYAIENSYLKKELCLENKIVGVYAGKFGGLYLKRETIEIFKAAYDFWGDQFRVLLLSNHDCTEILIWCKELELPSNIIVKRFVEFKNMPLYLSCANFAISPYSPIPSRRFGAPIKNAEYMAMGLPILITKDSANDSEFISQNNIGAVIGDLNYNSYFSAIRKIDVLLRLDNFELKSGISSIAKRHKNFDIADKIYQEIYSKSN